MENKILKKYTDSSFPSSFSGSENFFKALKLENKTVTRGNVVRVLSKQDAYTLHKPVRKNFARSKVIVAGIDDTWQIDLVDMREYARENKWFRYILTVIDVFSKYAWAVPIKNKNQNSVTLAFNSILTSSKRSPKRIHADEGKEFYNNQFKNLLNRHNCHLYSTKSPLKASIVERFNRTLKEKMWRMFTLNHNHKYYKDLPKLIESYNNSFHRSIKTKPILVNKNNELDIWHTLYDYDYENDIVERDKNKLKLKVGDIVRISELKKGFAKGYTQNWTNEIFIVYKLYNQNPIIYRIRDLQGEDIEGNFYLQELQKIDKEVFPFEILVIDQIFERRTVANRKEVLVNFIGKSKKEWINEKEVESISKKNQLTK